MEIENSKSLSSLIFYLLLFFIFIRPFISGLTYPAFEFWYEASIIFLAIGVVGISFGSPKPLGNLHPLTSLRTCSATCQAKYGLPIILLSLSYIISSIASININNSLKESLKFLSYISIFLTASQATDKQKKILIKTIVIAACIISLYSIYQYLWGYRHTIYYLKSTNNDIVLNSSYAKDILLSKRAIGTFPSPNILGSYLVMIFFLSLIYIQPRSLLRSATYATIIVIALILTKSLGAWFSLIATLIILSIISYRQFKKKKWLIATSFIFILFVIIFILLNRWERLMNLENPQNSITQRLNYWRTAIEVIKGHPLFGVGPGNFQEVFLKYKVGLSTNTRYAHNIFLHQWAETGIIGFAGMLSLITTFFIKGISKSRYLFLAALAFLFHNLIDITYFIPEVGMFWWIVLGLLNSPANINNG